jgi:hypothetical protein
MATKDNPNVETELSESMEGFTETLARASQEARGIHEIITAQRRENAEAAGDIGDANVPAGTTGRGQFDKYTNVHARIPWFNGTHPTYTWESFLTALEIAEMTGKYSEPEKKQMFLQNLDGAARMFLMANRHLLHSTYAEIKAVFGKRFASKKNHSLTKLRAMSMQPGEKVMLWYARILAVGDNIVAADTAGIADPERLASIHGQRETLDLLLQDQFKRGLRAEIRNQMKAETFASLESCAKAAEEAEEFLDATSVLVNHMGCEQVDMETHVHAVTSAAVGQVQKMNGRTPFGGQSSTFGGKGSDGRSMAKGNAENVVCFRCQKKGHYVRDCPEPPRDFPGQKKGGNKSGSYNKGNQSYKSRSNSNDGTVETHNISAEMISQLTEKLDRLCNSGRHSSRYSRSRSGSRSRSTSRSRHSQRSRSSSRRSRNSSHSRSNSRHQNTRRVNYSSSSKSKN